MTQLDLSGLHDIHLPVKPNFWPLPMGWYVIIIGLLIVIFMFLLLKRWYRNQPLPYALRELEKIKVLKTNQLKLLSQLLKRVAMAKYGRKEIAPLTGETWQDFLLSAAPDIFTQKQAHLLAFVMYAPDKENNDKTLYKKAQQWIKVVLKK